MEDTKVADMVIAIAIAFVVGMVVGIQLTIWLR